jgi:hypothetical protein
VGTIRRLSWRLYPACIRLAEARGVVAPWLGIVRFMLRSYGRARAFGAKRACTRASYRCRHGPDTKRDQRGQRTHSSRLQMKKHRVALSSLTRGSCYRKDVLAWRRSLLGEA